MASGAYGTRFRTRVLYRLIERASPLKNYLLYEDDYEYKQAPVYSSCLLHLFAYNGGRQQTKFSASAPFCFVFHSAEVISLTDHRVRLVSDGGMSVG